MANFGNANLFHNYIVMCNYKLFPMFIYNLIDLHNLGIPNPNPNPIVSLCILQIVNLL